MNALLLALFATIRDLVRRRVDLEVELIALRHKVLVLRRQQGQRRVMLRPPDRWLWVILAWLWSRWRDALILVKPETVVAWHRCGFRWYWRWKSRGRR